jgi:hypothetical protein
MSDREGRLAEPGRGPLAGLEVVEIAGIGPDDCRARNPRLVHGTRLDRDRWPALRDATAPAPAGDDSGAALAAAGSTHDEIATLGSIGVIHEA